jgi:hypothetical protein
MMIMKQRQRTRLPIVLSLLIALSFILVIAPPPSYAQVVCPGTTTDSDGDGFTDAQECAGLTLSPGNLFGNLAVLPTCAANTSGADRLQCVDPNSKDAFVIVTRASPSRIPTNPYQFISAAQSAGGLGITVHEITTTRTDRRVIDTSAQLAARLRESLDTSDLILGSANQGMVLDLATVFTQRIANFVTSTCAGSSTCADSNAATNGVDTLSEVIDHYIRHTISHELGGHVLTLAPVYNSRYGGNHYQSGTKVVLEQSVTYTKKSGRVTWYISSLYTDPDRAGARLQ